MNPVLVSEWLVPVLFHLVDVVEGCHSCFFLEDAEEVAAADAALVCQHVDAVFGILAHQALGFLDAEFGDPTGEGGVFCHLQPS